MRGLDFLGGSVSTRFHASGNLSVTSGVVDSGQIKSHAGMVAGDRHEMYQHVLSKAYSGDANFTQIQEYGFGGLDTILSPYSVYWEDTNLPHFENPTNTTDPNSLTLNPFNPNNELSLYYAPTGSQLYQASLTTSGSPTAAESGLAGSTSGWQQYGHVIDYASVGTGTFDGQPVDMNFRRDFNARGRVEVERVRSVGFRAPLVLTGWGFDMDGNPVPANTGDSTQFHDDAFKDPTLWKSGPVDLRWDDERKVWRAGGTDTRIYLCKATNTINTQCFSYEVERDNTLSQYTRNTLAGRRAFDGSSTETVYDPQNVAYAADTDNVGCRVNLEYGSIDAPMYEAFIIRQTTDPAGPSYYNMFTNDCSDCGSILNSGCGTQHGDSATDKKVLIENPLLQQIDVGTLMFTVNTGRTKNINTGEFIGGSGTGASGYIQTDENGAGSGVVTAGGTGYTYGAFALAGSGALCVDITVSDTSGVIDGITIDPSTGLTPDTYVDLTIVPNNASVQTEELPIHWILNSQKFTTTVISHVECQGGQLTKMSRKIQTEFQTCELPNDANTCAINSF